MERSAKIDFRQLVEEFSADLGSITRFYTIVGSVRRSERLDQLFSDWLTKLEAIDPEDLVYDSKIDYLLFWNNLQFRKSRESVEAEAFARVYAQFPFVREVIELEEARMRMEPLDIRNAAEKLDRIADLAKAFTDSSSPDPYLAAELMKNSVDALARWFEFYNAYDPEFTWWIAQPYDRCATGLATLHEKLRAEASASGKNIPGRPVGRDSLIADLEFEMIPYAPEELIEIGEREYAWCLKEIKKASAELGFGEDWRAAMEHVKNTCVEPGSQPRVVRELALEAVEWIESRNLLTVPELAKETWRMEMMPAESQKVNPFFLGGEAIIVSYPTHTMTHLREADEHARQQSPLFPSDGTTRINPGPPHAILHAGPLPPVSRTVLHSVLDRGLGTVLGILAMGQGIPPRP